MIGNKKKSGLTTKIKDRVYYWVSISILVTMIVVLCYHTKELDEIIDYSHEQSNRQIATTVDHRYQQVHIRDEKIKLIERDIVMMQKHHLEEIMEVIEHAKEK